MSLYFVYWKKMPKKNKNLEPLSQEDANLAEFLKWFDEILDGFNKVDAVYDEFDREERKKDQNEENYKLEEDE